MVVAVYSSGTLSPELLDIRHSHCNCNVPIAGYSELARRGCVITRLSYRSSGSIIAVTPLIKQRPKLPSRHNEGDDNTETVSTLTESPEMVAW